MNDEDDKLTIEALSNANSDLSAELHEARRSEEAAAEELDRVEEQNQALRLALNAARKRLDLQASALTAVGLVLKGFLSGSEESQG